MAKVPKEKKVAKTEWKMDYLQLKRTNLRKLITEFELTGNLFKLVEAMKIGVDILEIEEFPIEKWAVYKYKPNENNKKK